MDEWFERSPFVGFAPWIIYWVVADGPSTWLFGALCAVLSAIILGISTGFGGPRLLDFVTILFFVGVTAAGLLVAVPALIAAYYFTGRLDRLAREMGDRLTPLVPALAGLDAGAAAAPGKPEKFW